MNKTVLIRVPLKLAEERINLKPIIFTLCLGLFICAFVFQFPLASRFIDST